MNNYSIWEYQVHCQIVRTIVYMFCEEQFESNLFVVIIFIL